MRLWSDYLQPIGKPCQSPETVATFLMKLFIGLPFLFLLYNRAKIICSNPVFSLFNITFAVSNLIWFIWQFAKWITLLGLVTANRLYSTCHWGPNWAPNAMQAAQWLRPGLRRQHCVLRVVNILISSPAQIHSKVMVGTHWEVSTGFGSVIIITYKVP